VHQPDDDPLLDRAQRLLAELRERAEDPGSTLPAEDLLIEGYAAALALEGARRRLRERALELSRLELRLAAAERELRERLRPLREQLTDAGSRHESAPQRLH
jgi:uncharacterized membrane protein YccC